MAGVTGLEPAASGVTGQRSNRLSYTPCRDGERCVKHASAGVKQLAQVFFATLDERPDACDPR